MSNEGRQQMRDLIASIRGSQTSDGFNERCEELLALMNSDKDALDELLIREREVHDELDVARIQVASVTAKLANVALAVGEPEQVIEHHVRSSDTGPAQEVALSAFHILRYAGDIVPLRSDQIEAALESPDAEPDFADYTALFATTVAHLKTSAYYVLDHADCFAALASEPPQQETFPPLPFPRVWIEMRHLVPYMRFVDRGERLASRWYAMDILGVAIAEVQQGAVWDILLPFVFGEHPEFFVMGFRIAPDKIIDADPEMYANTLSFAQMRSLAVGGAHLITARNVPVRELSLPRHQRKRLASSSGGASTPKVYFVDLASAGEEHASVAASHGREYTCRWLVRGHWRHSDHGRTFCTCCDPRQIASWVEPYIKGPVGAPWKGRQIRRNLHAVDKTAASA